MRTQVGTNSGLNGQFVPTAWTRVERAAKGDMAACEELAQRYWYPLYAYLRRTGNSPHDAEDLVQGFMESLFSKQQLGGPDRNRGRFRSFLLAALQNFSRDVWRVQKGSVKRGFGKQHVEWDGLSAEERYKLDPAAQEDPGRLYDRAWANALMHEARERLRHEWSKRGQEDLFRQLEPALDGPGNEITYAAVAIRRGVGESAVRKMVHHLRRQFRQGILELLREERPGTSGPELDQQDLNEFYQALTS